MHVEGVVVEAAVPVGHVGLDRTTMPEVGSAWAHVEGAVVEVEVPVHRVGWGYFATR